MNNPRNRQAERRRMSGGDGADERRQRRRGAVYFNISRCAILTLGKPRARRATLTKFNMVSLRRVLKSTSRWRAMYAAARSAARAAGRAARGARRRRAGGAGGSGTQPRHGRGCRREGGTRAAEREPHGRGCRREGQGAEWHGAAQTERLLLAAPAASLAGGRRRYSPHWVTHVNGWRSVG